MSASVAGIFGHSVFSGGATQPTTKTAAAAGFAQIFTTMLAKQMHQSMVGEDSGPMGISGGASGDIYGSMLDGALGKELAKSKSMAGLRKMVDRELAGPRHPIASAFKDALIKPAEAATASTGMGQPVSRIATAAGHSSQFETAPGLRSDARGPLLLPPSPNGVVAPLLQPPSPLEG